MTAGLITAVVLAVSLDASTLDKIARGSQADRQGAVSALAEAGDAAAVPVLRATLEGRLYAGPEGPVLIDDGGRLRDALTGAPAASRDDLEKVSLSAPDRAERLEAARSLQQAPDPDVLPAVEGALTKEKDKEVREVLLTTQAMLALSASEPARRIAAAQQLRRVPGSTSKRLLAQRLAVESDPAVLAALKDATGSVEASLKRAEMVGLLFSGLSLGSVLLLAALGLAVTFGLMGVINMAHGELLMIGAYATWLVQTLFRRQWPGHFGWYLAVAVPASFLAAAAVGALLELTVVRKLYGRPLETLLATFGASLLLMQAVRSAFGAQNVEVANPDWMSGGITVLAGLVLPFNRIAILLFGSLVLLLVWILLSRTRLGLWVRAVTQNRQRAA
ncbi:MAG: urea ABC transporter permease subunit UrtB, partial [Deltaproteobacteria bacterium]